MIANELLALNCGHSLPHAHCTMTINSLNIYDFDNLEKEYSKKYAEYARRICNKIRRICKEICRIRRKIRRICRFPFVEKMDFPKFLLLRKFSGKSDQSHISASVLQNLCTERGLQYGRLRVVAVWPVIHQHPRRRWRTRVLRSYRCSLPLSLLFLSQPLLGVYASEPLIVLKT